MSDMTLAAAAPPLFIEVPRPQRVAPAPEAVSEKARPETPGERLRRLEASLTDDSQSWIERQDAQGEVDLRNLTRVGAVLATASTALMLWLLLG